MVNYNKDKIDHKLIDHSKKYFSKAKMLKAHEDKIHENLNTNNTKYKILSGNLNREDCDEDNARKFHCLLKRRATK